MESLLSSDVRSLHRVCRQLEIQSLHRECRQLELQKAKDSTAAGLEETVHSLTSKQRGHAEALRRLKATLHEKEEALQGREEALRKAQDELTEQVSGLTLAVISSSFGLEGIVPVPVG